MTKMTTKSKSDQILPKISANHGVTLKLKNIFSQIQADSRRRRAASSGSLNTLAVGVDIQLSQQSNADVLNAEIGVIEKSSVWVAQVN